MADPFIDAILEGGMEETADRGSVRSRAARAAPQYPAGTEVGDGRTGLFGGFNNILGPSAAQRADMRARELHNSQVRSGRAAAAEEQKMRQAMDTLMGNAADLAEQNPNVQAKDLFKMLLGNPANRKALLDFPAGSHTEVLSNIGKVLAHEPEKGVVVPGDAALASPTTGRELYKNVKPDRTVQDADIKAQAQHGATLMQKVYEDSQAATLDRPRIAELAEVAKRNPGGMTTAVRGYLANKGMNVQGASDLQLWESLLAQAAPRTREPGSGVFTDKDYEAAIRGLPGMLKSGKANQELSDLLLSLVDYRISRGEPAAGYLAGDKTRKEAFEALGKLKVGRGTGKPTPKDPLGLFQ